MISNGKNNYEDFEILLPLFMDVTNELFVVVRLDDEFKIEFINSCNLLEKLGYSHDSLVGTSFLDLIGSDDAKRIINLFKHNANNKKQSEEMKIKTSSHDTYWVEVTFKKFESKFTDNKVLINLKDISKQKDLESKLSTALQKDKHIIGRDITQSNLAEQKLRESEEKYRELADLLPDIIFETDNTLNLTYVNSAAFTKFGYTAEDLKSGLNISSFIHPQYKEKALLYIKSIFEGKETKPNEYLLCKKDGGCFYARVHSRPVFKDEKVVGIRGTITDIDEMVIGEERLKASEMKYRMLFENSPIALMEQDFSEMKRYIDKLKSAGNDDFEIYFEEHPEEILKCMTKANVIDVNKKMVEVYKANGKEELLWRMNHLGNDIDLMKRQELTLYNKNEILALIKGETMYESEFVSKTSTGDPIHLHAKTSLDPRFENTWSKVIVSIMDISERKHTEQKLKESEERYRLISENANDLIAVLDTSLNYEYLNKGYEVLGYSLEEIYKTSAPDLIHPEDVKKAVNAFRKGLKDGTNSEELRVKHKDGHYSWFEVKGKIFRDRNKESKALLISRDITERKKIEDQLKESEEKYRSLFENSPIALMDQDFSEMKKYIDHLRASGIDNFEKYFEDHPKEVLNFINKAKVIDVNRKTLQVYRADSKKDFISRMNLLGEGTDYKMTEEVFLDNKREILALINGDMMYDSEIVSKTLTGDIIHLYAKTSIVPGFETTWSKVIVSLVDITEEKLTEQKLKESEEKYRTITDQSILGITIVQNGVIKYINQKGADLLGYTIEEIMKWSPNDYAMNIHPEDRKFVIEQAKKKQLHDPEVEDHYQFRCFKKTGETIWIDNFSKIIDYEGSPADIVAATDITEMKKAQQALKESEEKYHQLFETSPDGVILTDSEGKIIECNSAIENITGYSITEFIGKNFLELEVYDENTKNVLLKGFKDLYTANKIEFVEFQLVRQDGEVRWMQVTGSLLTINAQNHILGVLHDITTIKNAQEALKKSREKYRDILETSSIGVLEIDVINNQIKYINPKLLDIIGYKKEELDEGDIRKKIIHPKDLQKLMETDEEMELEFRIIDKNGKLKWISGKRIPHFDDYENLVSTRLWLDDITEKKMYEELIYELNVNFLNFTTDIQNNIQLLLNTGLKLLNGGLIIYAHKVKSEDQEVFNIITSNNDSYTYNFEEFSEKLLINKYIKEGHDFPQTFTNIDQGGYSNSDPFIKQVQAKGSFGKVIRSQEESDNVVCVFYKDNPIINGQDKLVLFLICDAIEIEQRRWQVQQDLKEQNITLNKINKLKTELFSRTSHELKTPLISIKGFTELLLTLHKSKLDPETLSILEEIKDGSKRLEKIINLLLESAKLEAGQLELKKVKEDLTFLINFCVKELKGLAILRNQSIFFDPNIKVEAVFDKERIYEVISNLLLNAVKYTPPGGQISIQIHSKDNAYIVSVTDNGIGFTDEEKKQVFKQFGKIERYGQGWDVAIEGTGLGLYISKRLVELHGGKIWLTSEGRNKGSTFNFSIPMIT